MLRVHYEGLEVSPTDSDELSQATERAWCETYDHEIAHGHCMHADSFYKQEPQDDQEA